jgi:hypothetical protein
MTGQRPRRLRFSHVVAMGIVGTVILCVIGLVLAILWQRDPTPPPTLGDLAAAEARWRMSGPASYDLDLETTGRLNERVHLEVRGGKPKVSTVNGQSPKDSRVWNTWTVPRQFEYIRADMERPVAPGATAPLIRVEFDLENGLPREYAFSAPGENRGWRIVRFAAVGP